LKQKKPTSRGALFRELITANDEATSLLGAGTGPQQN
jgi:hypothetical protein